MSSPTARTLAQLRSDGWTAGVVEKCVPHSFIKQDLFGCIDIIAVKPGEGCIGIQACVVGDQTKRMKKALDEPRLRAWILSGQRFEVWGWALHGGVGKRKLWGVTRRPVTIADLDIRRDQ